MMTNVTTDLVLDSTNDRVSFPRYDGHGNTVATLSRHNGGYQVANVKRYDVWGKVRSDSGTAGSVQILDPNTRYCGNLGHKFDSTSGLTYMRARYYEAETGRFISEDPSRDGANWFAYANNNPVDNFDVSGKESIDVKDAFEHGLGILKFITTKFGIDIDPAVLNAGEVMVQLLAAIAALKQSQAFGTASSVLKVLSYSTLALPYGQYVGGACAILSLGCTGISGAYQIVALCAMYQAGLAMMMLMDDML